MRDDIRDFFGVAPVTPKHERLSAVTQALDAEKFKAWSAQFDLERSRAGDVFDAVFPCKTALDVLLMTEQLGRFEVERDGQGKLTIYFQNDYD
jgi:hypothetical protein